ncbi:hypothetical protein BH11ARM2_BH11ARM2_09920 [soil metagenome]
MASSNPFSWVLARNTPLTTTPTTVDVIIQPYYGVGSVVHAASTTWFQWLSVQGDNAPVAWPTYLATLSSPPHGTSVPCSVSSGLVGVSIPSGKSYKYRIQYDKEKAGQVWEEASGSGSATRSRNVYSNAVATEIIN